eukprot:UC4_evm3s1468
MGNKLDAKQPKKNTARIERNKKLIWCIKVRDQHGNTCFPYKFLPNKAGKEHPHWSEVEKGQWKSIHNRFNPPPRVEMVGDLKDLGRSVPKTIKGVKVEAYTLAGDTIGFVDIDSELSIKRQFIDRRPDIFDDPDEFMLLSKSRRIAVAILPRTEAECGPKELPLTIGESVNIICPCTAEMDNGKPLLCENSSGKQGLVHQTYILSSLFADAEGDHICPDEPLKLSLLAAIRMGAVNKLQYSVLFRRKITLFVMTRANTKSDWTKTPLELAINDTTSEYLGRKLNRLLLGLKNNQQCSVLLVKRKNTQDLKLPNEDQVIVSLLETKQSNTGTPSSSHVELSDQRLIVPHIELSDIGLEDGGYLYLRRGKDEVRISEAQKSNDKKSRKPRYIISLALIIFDIAFVWADVPSDLVEKIPGFEKEAPYPFKVYSGYLSVPGPFQQNEYQSREFKCAYRIMHNRQWALISSLYGAYGEMGYFQVDSEGTHINPYSWNQVANMLYLESPAGSNDPIGFSTCNKNGRPERVCSWDDKSQAEAYAHTLKAFFKAFPEFATNDLYLTGESYAGQYVPNIANYIVNNAPDLNLKGFAVGNACWGGSSTHVQCNGPNSEENDIDMYFGKGLVSKPLYKQIQQTCDFPDFGLKCDSLLEKASAQVGPHNIYDIYDNCPDTASFLNVTGKSMRWLKNQLRQKLDNNEPLRITESDFGVLEGTGGGYTWSCDGINAMGSFFRRSDVQEAMHLNKPGRKSIISLIVCTLNLITFSITSKILESGFNYHSSGPASVTLYPSLVKKLRILIYNGDSDACVPYKGNEEWTEDLAATGAIVEEKSWHPWFADKIPQVPAGYATTYTTGRAYGLFEILDLHND